MARRKGGEGGETGESPAVAKPPGQGRNAAFAAFTGFLITEARGRHTVPAALAAAPGTHDWAPEPPPMAKTAPSDGDPNPALRVCGVAVFPEPPTVGVSFGKHFFVDKYSCCDQDNDYYRSRIHESQCRGGEYSHITGI